MEGIVGAPRIYNLFPRLAGPMDQWLPHAERAARLGFDWLYLNPVTYPGFSGSLYAVKDHYRICPDFLPRRSSKEGFTELSGVLAQFRALGLKPILDLVINHTAFDSQLVQEHPAWFVRDSDGTPVHPSAIDPADARKVTVWGDLAEIDNAHSGDLDGLWDYWRALVRTYVQVGFLGFRCDAAYKVPAVLWRLLVDEAHEINPEVTFFAETLGCRIEETASLKSAGLDYLFNSSKYWMFDSSWALTQHEQFGAIAPSISFAESHDTRRLFDETGGNLQVQRQRYLFAALFSEGLLMPMGYEFCFRKRLDVVHSRPSDWEQTGLDLGEFIQSVNRLKSEPLVLAEEGHFRELRPFNQPTLVLQKSGSGEDRALVLVNKDWHQGQRLELAGLPVPREARLRRIDAQGHWTEQPLPWTVDLGPAEIALVY
jgi:starch synthase (maltosyl-transferring)